ncbi:MAG: zinc-ribbon domain-containing protein [Lachnospiraceae bacterium]|nr:zinc-ribbon domain-containing protein [Lachnospiraceae bacterium]
MSNLLSEVHPELIAEWSDKNLPLTPDTVTFGSNKIMWWKGSCGHEWQTSIKARSNGEGCPICSGARAVEGINDLTTLRPELAKEWSKKNKDLQPTMVTIGSSKKVIWKGKCGHEWIATVKSRAISKTGCPYCSHNSILEGFNDLASQKPDLAEEWSKKNYPLMPDMVTVFANRKVWWKCKECGNEWNTLISTRSGGSKCPYCSGLILLKGFNDLSTTYPQIASEWSERNLPLEADMVNAKSRKNVWWKCKKCGNEWKAVIHSRVNGSICPVCVDREVLSGYNDLATTDAHLLSEWDFEKNTKVLPTEVSRNSMKIVWWKCSLGHLWRGKIIDRTIEKKGCKVCEEEYLSVLPRLLVMFYAKRKNLRVYSDYDKIIGIPLEMYIREEKIAIETSVGTEKMEILKQHLCSKQDIKLIKVPYKIGMDEVSYASKIKKAFRSMYIFISSDEEKDVQFIRERFFEWRKAVHKEAI